ncbi:MAG: APC family permease [Candidatus Parcubacteria bacterium]|nr:APC family permease [Leptolyngbyaceae cyanobacterium LF-bin-113]
MSFSQVKQFLLGKTLPTSAHSEQRLSNATGLAVLSSDALSSVAYATQEILTILILAGGTALSLSLPIAGAIVLLLAIVVLSYQQTIRAYPTGGGAYTVSKENLGLYPSLIAAAALLIDYVLTVAVSISAGIDALTSAFPGLQVVSVLLCLFATGLIMLANLRGVKESGQLFMIPTYAFVVSIFLLVGLGLLQQATGQVMPIAAGVKTIEPLHNLTLFLILRAFAGGCTAMTGVEAISNGVLAFKPPEWQNARTTMRYMGILLGAMFLGITYLARIYRIYPSQDETVISQLGHQILGHGSLAWFYYVIQGATLLILLLAANTSYADFPRLSSLLARDGFMPRQLSHLGERLVFSNGIVVLSALAALLLVVFRGKTDALIPLYAVGVFTSFTLSQTGMVVHWFKERTRGWQASAVVNGIGSVATTVVLVILVLTKFFLGAWLIVVTIPIIVVLFLFIYRHYRYVAARLSIQDLAPRTYIARPQTEIVTHPAIVVVGQLHRGTIEALDYARSIGDEVVAVHVDTGSTNREKLQTRWQELESDIELHILESPYRSVVTPILNFVSEFEDQHPGVLSTIIIPAFVPRRWWESVLHNQTTLFLKAALRTNKRSRVVTTVRYYL